MGRLTAHLSLPFVTGYALHFAWVCCMFFPESIIAPQRSAPGLASFYLASMLVHMIALVGIGMVADRLHPRWRSPGAAGCLATVLFAGTMIASAADTGTAAGSACFAIGVGVTGIGSAYAIALWSWHLTHRVEEPATNLCAAYAVAALLFFALSLIPDGAFTVVVGAADVASMGVFAATARAVAEGDAARQGDAADGAAAGGRAQSGQAEASPHARTRAIVGTAGKDGKDGCTATGDASDGERKDGFMARICVASILFGCVIGLMNGVPQEGDGATGGLSYATLFMLASEGPLIALLAYLQFRSDSSPLEERLSSTYRIAVIVVLAALLLANAARETQLVFHAIALLGYIYFKMMLWTLFAHLARTRGRRPVLVLACGEACTAAGLLVGNLVAQNTGAGMPFPVVIDACIAMLVVAYAFVLTERKVVAIVAAPADEAPRHQRFRARCSELAEQNGLSKREAEVFVLFARGRSASRIADDLYVSTGTVQTHLRNLYRKLGVHSRQELIDLIEEGKRTG